MKELNKKQLTMVSGAGFTDTLKNLEDITSNWEDSDFNKKMNNMSSDIAQTINSVAKYISYGITLFNSIMDKWDIQLNEANVTNV